MKLTIIIMHARLHVPDPSRRFEEGGREGGERGFVDRTEKVHVGYDYRSRLVLPRLLIKYTSFWGES